MYSAWLEGFHKFVMDIGGATAEVMGYMVKMEADFHVLLVTLNALNAEFATENKLSDRNVLYPNFGYLYPEGTKELRKVWNDTTVRTALEPYANYLSLYDEVSSSMSPRKRELKVKASLTSSLSRILFMLRTV